MYGQKGPRLNAHCLNINMHWYFSQWEWKCFAHWWIPWSRKIWILLMIIALGLQFYWSAHQWRTIRTLWSLSVKSLWEGDTMSLCALWKLGKPPQDGKWKKDDFYKCWWISSLRGWDEIASCRYLPSVILRILLVMASAVI